MRIPYVKPDFGQAEIAAVMQVMQRGDDKALRIGECVTEFETKIAALFGKHWGVMCNSGSSALYLAVQLLDLPPGSEIMTPPLTFSTDVAAIIRSGHIPVFVDIDPLTLNIDCDAIEAELSPTTRAILVPNLAGNAPDWDRIRQIADRHGLKVIEDSCDTIAPTLRGTPTSTRADLSLTSFNLSHIITCAGQGGMLLTDDEDVRTRALLMRRWGRRSEAVAYGKPAVTRSFHENLDGVDYDSFNIFDEVAWNFEPSEMGAAFGLAQLKRLPEFAAQRKRNFRRYQESLSRHPGKFIVPRELEGLETTWQVFVATLDSAAGFGRAEVQDFMHGRGIETRTVWTGNIVRQPMLRNARFRTPPGGLPHSDAIFERGIAFPCNQGISDSAMDYVAEVVDAFMSEHSLRSTTASAGVRR